MSYSGQLSLAERKFRIIIFKQAVAAAILAVALIATSAGASIFQANFTLDAAGFTGSGVLYSTIPADDFGNHYIDWVTGSINGQTIKTSTYAAPDFLVQPDFKITPNGLSFLLSGGEAINIFFDTASNSLRLRPQSAVPNGGGHGGDVYSFVITDPSSVPEPATWALLLTGFGSVGFALRNRKHANAVFAA